MECVLSSQNVLKLTFRLKLCGFWWFSAPGNRVLFIIWRPKNGSFSCVWGTSCKLSSILILDIIDFIYKAIITFCNAMKLNYTSTPFIGSLRLRKIRNGFHFGSVLFLVVCNVPVLHSWNSLHYGWPHGKLSSERV